MPESIAHVEPRRPLLAGMLSFFAPGLGQFYNGQWCKALCFLLVQYPLGIFLAMRLETFTGLKQGFLTFFFFMALAVGDAAFIAGKRQHYVPGSLNSGMLYTLILLISLSFTIGLDWYLSKGYYQTFTVPSPSMAPTLVPGDKFMGAVLGPDDFVQRGDIVVFHPPENAKEWFVKRVVGLPGDVVHVASGRVSINGSRCMEPDIWFDRTVAESFYEPQTVRLGSGQFWVMGDNRFHSLDSRSFGPVQRERMGFKALYVYWPGQGIATEKGQGRLGQPLE